MAQYQLYSSSKDTAPVDRCPIDCLIPEYYCPVAESCALPAPNRNADIPFTIDYSRFINEISSKRQPSQLREISNYNVNIVIYLLKKKNNIAIIQ